MTEINLNMSVSVPDEIYEKFLIELGRDGFVFVKFGEYSLVLSMPDIEPVRTPYDAKMSQDELDKRDDELPQAQVKDGKIMCKCGHWIGIVGTKWQHIDIELTRGPFDESYRRGVQKKQIKYREKCYTCDCAEPTPLVRTNIAVRGE